MVFTELKNGGSFQGELLNKQMVIVALVSEGIIELPGRGEAEHGHEAKRKQSTTGHNPCLFHDEMGMVQNLWYHPDFDPYPNLKNMLWLFQSGDPNIQSPSTSSFGNVLCFNHGSTVLQRKTSPLSLQGLKLLKLNSWVHGRPPKYTRPAKSQPEPKYTEMLESWYMLPTGEVTTRWTRWFHWAHWKLAVFKNVGRDIP